MLLYLVPALNTFLLVEYCSLWHLCCPPWLWVCLHELHFTEKAVRGTCPGTESVTIYFIYQRPRALPDQGISSLSGHWRPAWSFAIMLFKLANAPLQCPNKVPKCYIMTPSEYHCLRKGSWNGQSMMEENSLGTQYFSFGSIQTSVVTLLMDWFLCWSPDDRESMSKLLVAVWSIISLKQSVYHTKKNWTQATQTI